MSASSVFDGDAHASFMSKYLRGLLQILVGQVKFPGLSVQSRDCVKCFRKKEQPVSRVETRCAFTDISTGNQAILFLALCVVKCCFLQKKIVKLKEQLPGKIGDEFKLNVKIHHRMGFE